MDCLEKVPDPMLIREEIAGHMRQTELLRRLLRVAEKSRNVKRMPLPAPGEIVLLRGTRGRFDDSGNFVEESE